MTFWLENCLTRCRLPARRVVVLALLLALALPILVGPLDTARATHGPAGERAADGGGNNVAHPDWGRAGTPLRRVTTVGYADGVSVPAGAARPGARAVSNRALFQTAPVTSTRGASGWLWQWGQFVDHDITLVPLTDDPTEPFMIPLPPDETVFVGVPGIPLTRSAWDPASGTGSGNPRQQMNAITAYIDGSNVYGSDAVRAAALRANDGTGRLKTSAGDLLPFNTEGLPNAGGTSAALFLAGDERANEQVALTAVHTLFVREHNHWADTIRSAEPGLSGDEVYWRARRRVEAELQVITYHEFLPLLLGPDALPPYSGYDPTVEPSIDNFFAAAAYRVGHSMLPGELLRLGADGTPIAAGPLALRDAFFAPFRLTVGGDITPLLRGLAGAPSQEIDVQVIDDVRNFLFGPPGAGGFDLAALNIQRGRDHGLPGYNQARVDYGLAPVATLADISSDPDVQARLAAAYADVDEIDAWVGALAEDHVPGAIVGPLMHAAIADQFRRLRDGDRFWYARVLHADVRADVEATTLADVIRRNTDAGPELPDHVFLHRPHADLALTLEAGRSPVAAGTGLAYHIRLENRGPDHARAVEVTDVLPSQMTFTGLFAPGWHCDTPEMGQGGTVRCMRASLPVGTSELTLNVTVRPGAMANMRVPNHVTVRADGEDPTPGDHDATADVQIYRAHPMTRGDVNGDTVVDAADLSALVLELFDGDGVSAAAAGGGDFPGVPEGGDANGDTRIDAGDLSCLVRLIFEGPGVCGTP